MKSKISLEPYKGVRDFYPEDLAAQKWMFGVMRNACERVGYEEMAASVLEPTDLYIAKSSEEMVKEETYTFEDRGGRSVTLRPEMTPTVARMVAARKRDLAFPLRWYSIQNMFRYDRPQKGRLREHWQLNADLFGVSSLEADMEIIGIAHGILTAFGAKEGDFEIRINDRGALISTLDAAGLAEDERTHFISLLDKKEKISEVEFASQGEALIGKERFSRFLEEQQALESASNTPSHALKAALESLAGYPIRNIRIDRSMVRGFTYYTGMVFEVFDTDPSNRRSLFGGGRYDRLIEELSGDAVPAVGFGMGDVTLRDFLDTRGLIPKFVSPTKVMLCLTEMSMFAHAVELTNMLRQGGVNTAIDLSGRKVGDQIKGASKKGVRYVIVIGPEEKESGTYSLKRLEDGHEVRGCMEVLAGVCKEK